MKGVGAFSVKWNLNYYYSCIVFRPESVSGPFLKPARLVAKEGSDSAHAEPEPEAESEPESKAEPKSEPYAEAEAEPESEPEAGEWEERR